MSNTFKNRLKKLRIKNNLTQEEVAQNTHITRTTLSRYESGEFEPNINVVTDLAKYFNVSVDWLSGYSDIEDPNITSTNLLKLYNSLSSESKIQAFNFLQYLNFMNTNTFHNFKQDIANNTTISTTIPADADFVTICDNDSMKPIIEKGEFIFIKKEENIKNNDLIFININGTSAMGKFKSSKKDTRIIPINESFEPIILIEDNYTIIGKIINK